MGRGEGERGWKREGEGLQGRGLEGQEGVFPFSEKGVQASHAGVDQDGKRAVKAGRKGF